jgi:hypothetical protein
MNVKTAVKTENNTTADEIELIISPFFLRSSLRSRLASIIIIIRPKVPITGSTGSRFGISSFVDLVINWIPIPRAIRKITPGIFVYLLVISKI